MTEPNPHQLQGFKNEVAVLRWEERLAILQPVYPNQARVTRDIFKWLSLLIGLNERGNVIGLVNSSQKTANECERPGNRVNTQTMLYFYEQQAD